MQKLTRRSAFKIGAASAAAVPVMLVGHPASAGLYGDDAGQEIMPGIRMVALGEWPVDFGGYKRAVANDYIIGPGTGFPEEAMKNDMLCQIIEGELRIVHNGMEFVGQVGHVFSCVVGTTESDANDGNVPAIMRVIDLFPA